MQKLGRVDIRRENIKFTQLNKKPSQITFKVNDSALFFIK